MDLIVDIVKVHPNWMILHYNSVFRLYFLFNIIITEKLYKFPKYWNFQLFVQRFSII